VQRDLYREKLLKMKKVKYLKETRYNSSDLIAVEIIKDYIYKFRRWKNISQGVPNEEDLLNADEN